MIGANHENQGKHRMASRLETYRLQAYNTAKLSENKMHDDTVAKRFGFSGGLVPGVDVMAYMMHLPVAKWGRAFLERGLIEARFVKPVYDGEIAEVRGEERDGVLSIGVESRGQLCATVPRAWAGEAAREYLADVRERDPIYPAEGLGHPGLLQRVMNKVLVDNAVLGPWIHVGSRMQLINAARSGDELTARAKVTGNYEKKGHRFVELDALVVGNARTPLAHCQHIAIYQPREQAAA
jgi:acyl dehydratase